MSIAAFLIVGASLLGQQGSSDLPSIVEPLLYTAMEQGCVRYPQLLPDAIRIASEADFPKPKHEAEWCKLMAEARKAEFRARLQAMWQREQGKQTTKQLSKGL
jgi:hypothetical protein